MKKDRLLNLKETIDFLRKRHFILRKTIEIERETLDFLCRRHFISRKTIEIEGETIDFEMETIS